MITGKRNTDGSDKALDVERGRAQKRTCWSVEGQAKSGRIELLLMPGQLFWRDENSDKYYRLST